MSEIKTRILLVENGLLGDYCATVAVGQALKKLFPDAKIVLLVKTSAGEFFKLSSFFNEIIFFDLPWTRVGLAQFAPQLWIDLLLFLFKMRKRRYDYIITIRRDPYQYILLFLLRGNKRILPHKDAPVHYSEKAFSVVRELGYREKVTPTLEITEFYQNEACRIIKENYLEKSNYILVHPGASYFLKRWHPEGFAELHILLNNSSWRIAYMGSGKSDREFIEKIKSLLNQEIIYFNLPLLTSIAVVSLSAVVIGMDSGFSHIAAALGVPTIALYGPASSGNTGIIGSRVKLIDHHSRCFCRSWHLHIPYSCLTLCSLNKTQCKAMLSISAQEVYLSVLEMLSVKKS